MQTIRCECCGSTEIQFHEDQLTGICKSCGSFVNIPADFEDKANLYQAAQKLRFGGKYALAATRYQRILSVDYTEPAAHWGYLLSRYGVEYFESGGRYLVRCHTLVRESILQDPSYLSLLQYAPPSGKPFFEEAAARIDRMQSRIRVLCDDPNVTCDIVIAYDSDIPDDRKTAEELKNRYTEKGLEVFSDPMDLAGADPETVEELIYPALYKASALIVIGSSQSAFLKTEVLEDWMRFLEMRGTQADKVLYPVYRNMKPEELPSQLAAMQALDCSEGDFSNRLDKAIEKQFENRLRSLKLGMDLRAEYARAEQLLQAGQYSEAISQYESIVSRNAQDSSAHWGIVRAMSRDCTEIPFENKDFLNAYDRAVQFANAAEKTRYQELVGGRLAESHYRALCEETNDLQDFSQAADLYSDQILDRCSYVIKYGTAGSETVNKTRRYQRSFQYHRKFAELRKKYTSSRLTEDPEVGSLAGQKLEYEETIAGCYQNVLKVRTGKHTEIRMMLIVIGLLFLALLVGRADWINHLNIPFVQSLSLLFILLTSVVAASMLLLYITIVCRMPIVLRVLLTVGLAAIGVWFLFHNTFSVWKYWLIYLIAVLLIIELLIIFRERKVIRSVGSIEEVVAKDEAFSSQIRSHMKKELEDWCILNNYEQAEPDLSDIKLVTADGFGPLLTGEATDQIRKASAANSRRSVTSILKILIGIVVVFLIYWALLFAVHPHKSYSDVADVSVSNTSVAFLFNDGTVKVRTKRNNFYTDGIKDIEDAVQVSVNGPTLAVLRSDGTVFSNILSSKIREWTDIREVIAGFDFVVGLRSDGTCAADGSNEYGQCNVTEWTDIQKVITQKATLTALGWYTTGLKTDGSLVSTIGSSESSEEKYVRWFRGGIDRNTNVVSVSNDAYNMGYVFADGTVLVDGAQDNRQTDVEGWTDIAKLLCPWATYGLRTDGTVLVQGDLHNGNTDAASWQDITDIAAGEDFVIGLHPDGTVEFAGSIPDVGGGGKPVDKWKNVERIYAADNLAIGLRTDGSLEVYGQTDVYGLGSHGSIWTPLDELKQLIMLAF